MLNTMLCGSSPLTFALTRFIRARHQLLEKELGPLSGAGSFVVVPTAFLGVCLAGDLGLRSLAVGSALSVGKVIALAAGPVVHHLDDIRSHDGASDSRGASETHQGFRNDLGSVGGQGVLERCELAPC
jgi:hypothetical protein